MISKILATFVLLTMALLSVASASTITTGSPTTNMGFFGAPTPSYATTSYGETFAAPGGALQSWSFYVVGATGNFNFEVAAWDGSKAVGPLLYSASSAGASTAAAVLGNTQYSWNGINLNLTSGLQYIAFITVAGVSSPTSAVPVGGTSTDTYSGGAFRFLNSNGVDPLALNIAWDDSFAVPDLAFSATFGASAVPELSTWAMLILGFAGIGFIGYRRKQNGSALCLA